MKIAILTLLLAVAVSAQQGPIRQSAKERCSVNIVGSNNRVFTCTGMDKATANEMVSLLNALLAKEPDRTVVMARLDSIIETLKQSSGERDKKIEDLAVRIDCSSATPEAMAVAIAAHATDRVLGIWRCRPENIITGPVRTAFLSLFSSEDFPASKAFLDQLTTKGLNIAKEIKPSGQLHVAVPSGMIPIVTAYSFLPVGRSLMEGNISALEWIVTNAPPGYWKDYPFLMLDLTGIMRLASTPPSTATVVHVISLLRQAGVPVESNDYEAFRESYKRWLRTQLPEELRSPLQPIRIMQGSRVSQTRQLPGQSELWKAVSDALVPNSPDDLRRTKSGAVTEITDQDFQSTSKAVQDLTDQLAKSIWWRKIPQTRANLDEAARRQATNVFDNYGYVPVAAGDLQDEDVINNQHYPDCGCLSVKDVRDKLSTASRRKTAILEFRAKYS